MAAQKTHYLVDFENVGLKGLEGAEKLSAQDRIHLFSTEKAAKIDTATLSRLNVPGFKVYEVPSRKQSVDMHLVSWLGYLLAEGEDARYVIVSNDTDYDGIIRFWKAQKGVSVQRRANMKNAGPQKPTLSAKKPEAGDRPAQGAGKPAARDKVALNQAVQLALGRAGIDNNQIGYVASRVAKHYGKDHCKQGVYRDIISKFGQKKGLEVYNCIRSLL